MSIIHKPGRLRDDSSLGRFVSSSHKSHATRWLTLALEWLLLLLLLLLLHTLLLKPELLLVLLHQPVLVGQGLKQRLLRGVKITLGLQELELRQLMVIEIELRNRLSTGRSWSTADGRAIFRLEALVGKAIVATNLLLLLLARMVLGTLHRGKLTSLANTLPPRGRCRTTRLLQLILTYLE